MISFDLLIDLLSSSGPWGLPLPEKDTKVTKPVKRVVKPKREQEKPVFKPFLWGVTNASELGLLMDGLE